MKGIILAGDSGHRLYPVTSGIPKQLLPIYDRPMIYYPVHTLAAAGIDDILIITTTRHQPLFRQSLGDGSRLGVRLCYAIQDEARGIAEAITIGQAFIGDDAVCLITGDTIITGDSLPTLITKAGKAAGKSGHATIFVKRDNDPEQYGKVVLDQEGKYQAIVGQSDEYNYYSITGLYIYPSNVVNAVQMIEPSNRGKLEITHVNRLYMDAGKLQIKQLNDCLWHDTNTFDTILQCGCYMKQLSR